MLDDSANIRVKRLEELGQRSSIPQNLNHVAGSLNGIRVTWPARNCWAAQASRPQAHRLWRPSGDPEILRSIDKKVDRHDPTGLQECRRRLTWRRLPSRSSACRARRETMQRTIDFAIELDPVIANFSAMTPIPAPRSMRSSSAKAHFLINDWETTSSSAEGATRWAR